MNTSCLESRKDSDNINSKMIKTKNDRLMLSLPYSVCKNKISRFIKEKGAKESVILSSLGLNTPFRNIPGLNILL